MAAGHGQERILQEIVSYYMYVNPVSLFFIGNMSCILVLDFSSQLVYELVSDMRKKIKLTIRCGKSSIKGKKFVITGMFPSMAADGDTSGVDIGKDRLPRGRRPSREAARLNTRKR